MAMPKQIRPVRITGTGMFVPPRVVTNADLEKLMETSDEWIQQRSGIRERRHVDPGMTPADLAEAAAMKALAQADLTPKDIDLLIVATLSPQHYFPGTAAFLQRRLDMGTTPAMDLRCQCTGFLYALDVAKAMIASGSYNRILLCGVEVHSRTLDFSTRGRDVAVLFGDGAGAVVLEPSPDPERGILGITLHSDGNHAEKLWVEAPTLASAPHMSPQMMEEGRCSPQMDGRFVFKHAVVRLPEVVGESLQKLHLKTEDIDMFLFHQANLRINEAVAAQMRISPKRLYNNIDRYGNCSAASIPMCLAETVEQGLIKSGSMVCMAAFGSGFTWGSAVIRW